MMWKESRSDQPGHHVHDPRVQQVALVDLEPPVQHVDPSSSTITGLASMS
jgi:hypothetical protein